MKIFEFNEPRTRDVVFKDCCLNHLTTKHSHLASYYLDKSQTHQIYSLLSVSIINFHMPRWFQLITSSPFQKIDLKQNSKVTQNDSCFKRENINRHNEYMYYESSILIFSTILELFNNFKNVSPDGKTTVVKRILYVEHFLRWEQVSIMSSGLQGRMKDVNRKWLCCRIEVEWIPTARFDQFKYSLKICLIFAIFGYFWTESEWRYKPQREWWSCNFE